MKKLLSKRRSKKQQPSSRITNDTVAEHRERILAGAKRYKYPLQYTRRKLISNTIIIGVATVVLLVAIGWWQLYLAQNSSAFFYRITRIVPLPVATVDGETARYSDYLLRYRAAEHYLGRFDEIRLDSDDGQLQLKYMKREALDNALADALARRIAREESLSVSEADVEAALLAHRSAANGVLSEETSNIAVQRVIGLSSDDNELLIRNSLLRVKAAHAIDEPAEQAQARLGDILARDDDLEKAAQTFNRQQDDGELEVQYGVAGWVNNSASFEGVPAGEIAELDSGQVSEQPLRSLSGKGYFFVKVLNKNDSQVNLEFIHIPLTVFSERLQTLKDEGKVNEFITIRIDQPDEENQEE